jgi:hypothetical protein
MAKFLGARRETDMARPSRAMRRRRIAFPGRLHRRDGGIEDKQHLLAAAEENLSAFGLRHASKADHAFVEGTHRGDILGIEDGFEYRLRPHATACF